MKKIILLFFIIYPFRLLIVIIASFCLSFILALNAHAASPSPESNQKVLEDLRDRVASTVAKLNLVERRGIIGKVSDISNTQITLNDVKGNTRFVDVDELTKFSSLANSGSFGISDIKKGSTLGVLGLYNKQSRRILARSVAEITLTKMVNGNIATIDRDNFLFHVATGKNEQYKVSVETTTRTFSYDLESQELIRSGFSKLKENEKVFVKGEVDQEDEKKISADKIIVFPDIVKTPNIPNVQVPLPSPTTSTGSGKKLTPITR